VATVTYWQARRSPLPWCWRPARDYWREGFIDHAEAGRAAAPIGLYYSLQDRSELAIGRLESSAEPVSAEQGHVVEFTEPESPRTEAKRVTAAQFKYLLLLGSRLVG
jgi:hypothetical protein